MKKKELILLGFACITLVGCALLDSNSPEMPVAQTRKKAIQEIDECNTSPQALDQVTSSTAVKCIGGVLKK